MIGAATLCLNELLSDYQEIDLPPHRLNLDSAIVLLRLAGNVSLSGISEILRMQGYPNYSASMVSERLKDFGSRLPDTLNLYRSIMTFYLSDEIYACGLPILVTIDPVSTAILKIELSSNCQSNTWKAHFKSIESNDIFSQGLASDRGVGIVKGYQQFQSNLIWCSDHFHEFCGLTKLLRTLESQAYEAITREAERFRVFNNARTESNLQKQLEAFEEAKVDCEKKMANYQHVENVLERLFPALYFFDLKTGEHRQKSKVKAELLTLMDLLDQLELDKLQQETKAIRSHIDDICICYQQVEDIFQKLSQTIVKENLEMIGLAWQHDHQSHQHKGAHKKYHENERDGWLEIVTPLLGKNANALIERAFEEFNGMVRTSSLIEMVNSLIRPYINECKGQMSQEHLNLIMFYHNHHQYKSGKRKGKAPIELLMKKKLEKSWLELLFETISQTE